MTASHLFLQITINSKIIDFLWASGPNETSNGKYVYGVTAGADSFPGGPLWLSDNFGKPDSWRDATSLLGQAIPANESSLGALGVVSMHWHKDRPQYLYVQGNRNWCWVSEDYGTTFKAYQSPGGTYMQLATVSINPKRPEWLLARTNRLACNIDPRSPECAGDLFISKDFGVNWQNLTMASKGRVASFRDYDWGSKLELFKGKPTPDEAIFATAYLGTAHRGLYPGWDKDIHYIVSLDLFQSDFAKVVPCGNIFEVVSHKVYVAAPSDCPLDPSGKAKKTSGQAVTGRTVTLLMSDGDGDEFVESCLPVNLEDDGYMLVKTHDGWGTFVLADHAEPGSTGPLVDSPVSDAYSPAYNGSLYTLSLKNIYRRDYITDFARVEGLPGMYIANAVDDAAMVPGASQHHASFLTSKLTLNGGSDWRPLNPPSSYRFGVCNTCPAGGDPAACKLHIHGTTSWFAPEGPRPNLYSLESAPGIVLATGNVGAHLDFTPDADCTWLSRDGGITWEDIYPATAIYEIGDGGGLILMAAHRSEGPTDSLMLSLDQGGCWDTIKLPEAITVENIRVDPHGSAHVFIVHGTACLKTEAHPNCGFTGGSTPPSKMFIVDAKEMLGSRWRDCDQGPDSADYEKWEVPSPALCLMGESHVARRRRRDAGCANGELYDDESERWQVTPCNCTVADTECEYGYAKGGVNNTCVVLADLQPEACPDFKNSGYRVSQTHLRLVHANKCKGINTIIHDTDGKGGKPGGGGGGGCSKKDNKRSFIGSFFLLLVIGGIVAVVGGLVWSQCMHEGQRAALMESASPILSTIIGIAMAAFEIVSGLWDTLLSKLGGLASRRRAEAAYFEPLAGDAELDLEPDDYRSPPLFHQGP